MVTTNLPFSEWISVFPDPRLCKAVVERLTYRSHIIETGTESFRFKQSLARSTSARAKPSAEPQAGPSKGADPPPLSSAPLMAT